MTEKLGNICSNVLNNINIKKESKSMDREKIIELVKELGITAEELGIEPRVEKALETIRDEQFIHEVSEYIKDREDEETARDYINEKYWDDLGIRPKKKYKVVECRLEKKIYKNILVAMPEEDDDSNVEDYYDYYYVDDDDCDDEDEWEIDYTNNHETDLTAEQLRNCYGDDVINIDDFEE